MIAIRCGIRMGFTKGVFLICAFLYLLEVWFYTPFSQVTGAVTLGFLWFTLYNEHAYQYMITVKFSFSSHAGSYSWSFLIF